MSTVGLTSAITGLKAAETMGQVQTAVAAKVLDASKANGEAAVALIEAAAESMEQAIAQVSGAMGNTLDVVA